MSFGQAISSAVHNLTNFTGRSSRSAFWWWYLLMFVASIIAQIILGAILGNLVQDGFSIAGLGIWSLIVAIIFQLLIIAVGCRRLHDRGLSGWLQLLLIIPPVGTLILVIMWLLPGQAGDNNYGPPATA